MKGLIDFIKAMRLAFPSCAKKAAQDKLNSCGALPTPDDISLRGGVGNGWKTSHWGPGGGNGFYQAYDNLKSGKGGERFFPGSASNYTCDQIKSSISRGISNGMIEKTSQELQQSGPARIAKWLYGAAAAYAASQLAGCSPGGKEQELYDAFDAAQLEGDMDPVEAMQRAMRQAKRNQQNGSGGCGCGYSVVEAGAGVNYGNTCNPPDKFKPPGYSYPGYMELRKNCGNNPSSTSSLALGALLELLEN